MSRPSSIVTLAAGVALLFALGNVARTSEIRVLGVPALKEALDVIGPRFESDTGHRIDVSYAGSSDLIQRFDAGEAFDVALVWPAMIDRLLEQGRIAAGTRAEVAQVAIAVAVKKGAPKPDMSTVEAFKRTLLNATSVSMSLQGASGIYFKGLLERLGIAAEMQPKLKPVPGGPFVVGPVARGEVELAVITTPYIVVEPGAELVGPLPGALQQYIVYTAGMAAGAPQPDAARALIAYLRSPVAAAVLKSKGLDPAAP